jgi:Flp pilus assembly protein TadG
MSFVRRLWNDQQGQSVIFVTLGLIAMLGMGGLTIDLGRFFVIRSQLQNSVNAAGLAAAGDIWDSQSTNNAVNAAKQFITYNPISGLTEDTGYPSVTTTCLNSLLTSPQTCANTGNIQNALKVVERVSMPTYFMRIFGVKSLTAQATATASMEGIAQPWNIALILDATGSMADADTTDPDCSGQTKMQCSLHGLQTLLSTLNPCVVVANCVNSNATVHVALFAFPNMLTSALPHAFTGCSGSSTPVGAPNASLPTTMWYAPITLPQPGLTGYTPLTYQQVNVTGKPQWAASYEITYPVAGSAAASDADANGFVSDYYQASNAVTGNLNPSSSLVEAIGYTGTGTQYGCMPVAPNGIDLNSATNVGASILHISSTAAKDGESASGGTQETSTTVVNTIGVGQGITYIAPAVYAAQAALVAEQALNVQNGMPAGQNAIIVLSDGGMNAQWIYFPQGQMGPPATGSSTVVPTTSTSMFTYTPPTSGSTTAATFVSGSGSTSFKWPPTSSNSLSSNTLNTTPKYTAYVAYSYSPANGAALLSDLASGTNANTGLYPDFIDQCQQAIMAAQYAAGQGTRVYSVAYQAASSACSSGSRADDFTDATLVATGTYNTGTYSAVTSINACNTVENMASSLEFFYSDSGSGASSTCLSPDWPDITNLSGIFGQMSATFSGPRLVPNGAT